MPGPKRSRERELGTVVDHGDVVLELRGHLRDRETDMSAARDDEAWLRDDRLDEQLVRRVERDRARRRLPQRVERGLGRARVERAVAERSAVAPSVSTKSLPLGWNSLPSRRSSVASATGFPPDDAASTSPSRSRPPRSSARSPGSIEIHIVPPHTRPVSHARSSVSSYSRSDVSPVSRTRLRFFERVAFDAATAERSGEASEIVDSSFAPTTCGVLPVVRTTVQTAKRRPSRSSSAIRA